jgi:hypothetical protein
MEGVFCFVYLIFFTGLNFLCTFFFLSNNAGELPVLRRRNEWVQPEYRTHTAHPTGTSLHTHPCAHNEHTFRRFCLFIEDVVSLF